MRLNSHAYLSKLEADEEWVNIDFRDLSNCERVWSKLDNAPDQELPMDLSPEEYFLALLPSTALFWTSILIAIPQRAYQARSGRALDVS